MPRSGLTDLQAKDAISSCLNWYAFGMDLRKIEQFLAAWHPDATWSISAAVGAQELLGVGHAGITGAVETLWSLEQMVLHATTNHEITVTSPTEAKGECHAVVLGVTKDGQAFFDGVVYPSDRYELRDGAWRLAYRRVEVGLHLELEPTSVAVRLFSSEAGAFPTF